MTPESVIIYDFESDPIDHATNKPPRPVGVALKFGREPGFYMAWGHATGNNCTKEDAARVLGEVWASGRPLLGHNQKFDASVAFEHFGLPYPTWDRFEDTMFLLFLNDPHEAKLELKPAAEKMLAWPPEEKDAVSDYVWENRKALKAAHPGSNVTRQKGKVSKLYEWFARVPGHILAPYAVGDVERTFALWEMLRPKVCARGMEPAYNREKQLVGILLENERVGMRVDMEALRRDIPIYEAEFERVENALRVRLGVPDLNFNEDQSVADALESAGVVDPATWVLTKKSGERSVSKKNLTPEMFLDPQVASALGYRNRLETCLKMFMKPWLRQAEARGDGYISTNWNQTRGGSGGTRTGRPSTSNPNFLNLSKNFEGRTDGYIHPEFLGLRKLPLVREYILPDEGHVFLHRDFSGQELRVFAHFECGELFKAYLADASVDPHKIVGAKMSEMMGKEFERTKVKVLNFQSLYGGGAPAVAQELRCSLAEAKEFKVFHDKALPGRVQLVEEIKRVIGWGLPIRTWGGREYYEEPPGFSEKHGRHMDFKYKLINYIVQGSAADLTKQALVDWYNDPRRDSRCRFMVTVYDEIDVSCPIDCWEEQMAILKDVMEAPRLSVPMLSDGKVGPAWGKVAKCA